jgi:hypothetical protein
MTDGKINCWLLFRILCMFAQIFSKQGYVMFLDVMCRFVVENHY